jgi:radical SAM superfamily enzyme YgiQ (UPF0313 family)
MKIILCYPPQRNYPGYGQEKRWLPLGIASLGAYIKKHNPEYDIVLLDLFNYTLNEAIEEITDHLGFDKNIVGFTCFTEQRMSVFELCKILKSEELDEFDINTVIGGPHAQIMANQIFSNYKYVDYIIKGEGEKALLELINDIELGLMEETPRQIREASIIHNLDEIPHAIDGFELFANNKNIIEAEAPIVFSRGCTDYCTFCSTTKFWKGYRSRSASNVFDEMLKYYTKYNITKFKFHDDASTADISNWKKLCRMIINFDYKLEYEITARADQFDDELVNLLSQSGCKRVCLGIESGNEALRKSMNKNLDIELAKINIKKLMQAGIEVNLLFIVNYPGETDKTIKDTVNFIRETKPTMYCKQPLMVFPGTKVYRDLVKQNLINDDYWLKDQPQPYYSTNWNKVTGWIEKINNANKPINILIAVPARQKEEIFNLHIESLNMLEIPENVNITRLFILHNSENLKKYLKDTDYLQIINTKEDYEVDDNTHHWKYENLNTIASIKNEIVNVAIKGNFDYIFWIDSDLILYPKTLKVLLETNKDIISEIFWTKWEENRNPEPNAWDFDHYGFIQGTMEKYMESGTYKCGGTGACILVNTDVYKSGANYTSIPNISFTMWEDRAFCVRAYCAGYEVYINSELPAFHIYRKKYIEEGRNFLDLFKNIKQEV